MHFWTSEEDGYVRAHYGLIPRYNIALYLGRTEDTVKARAGKLGVQKQGQDKYWEKWEEDYLMDNFSTTQKEIMTIKLGRTWTAIKEKAKRLGIKRQSRARFVKGINHYFFDTWSKDMAYIWRRRRLIYYEKSINNAT